MILTSENKSQNNEKFKWSYEIMIKCHSSVAFVVYKKKEKKNLYNIT